MEFRRYQCDIFQLSIECYRNSTGENPVSQHPDFLESSSLLPGPGLVMIPTAPFHLRFAQKHQMKPHSFPANLLISANRRYFPQALEL